MEKFKTKSMNPAYTDRDIENGCHTISFLSFERAIRESLDLNREKGKVKGYYITAQGISIIWE